MLLSMVTLSIDPKTDVTTIFEKPARQPGRPQRPQIARRNWP
jgi:hypothetical protein